MAVWLVRVRTAEVELQVSGAGASEMGDMWYPWLQGRRHYLQGCD